jgi:hypothetical protein
MDVRYEEYSDIDLGKPGIFSPAVAYNYISPGLMTCGGV